MSISPSKEQALRDRMHALGIYEHEIEEHFVRSSGKGGQHANKASTCVYLKHRPSGIEVKCEIDRSQAMNRFLARRILAQRVEAQMLGKKSAEQQKWEKIRRQKRRRSRRAKEKMLAEKHHRAQIKEQRSKIKEWD